MIPLTPVDDLTSLYGVAPEEARGKIVGRKECYRYSFKQSDFKGKDRKDRLFYRYMREIDLHAGKDPYDVYSRWTYGVPQGDSAYLSVRKYESPLAPPDRRLLMTCIDWCKRHFRCMAGSRTNWDFDYIKTMMNLSSSPGFPYNRSCFYGKGSCTKREIFEKPEHVFAEVEKLKDSFLAGNVCEIYVCSPKEELRLAEKVRENKFRTFTSASFRNTALGIALFGDMTSKFYAESSVSGFWSKVGTSLFNRGWDNIYRELNIHPNAFEGDFSSYDAILHPDWIESLGEIFCSFFSEDAASEENLALTRAYFQNILYGQIICPNGELYSKFQGNPSGSALTIVTNTMIHYMLFVYAWLKLGGIPDYMDFHNNVACVLCGDDSLWTVSDLCVGFFNIEAVARVFNDMGLIMKPEATKRGKLLDLKFLSHSFDMQGGMVFPIPDAVKVVSSMLYKSLPMGKDHDDEAASARLSLLKANALRITSWCCKPVRKLLQDYIDWLHLNYATQLRSPCRHQGPDQFSYADVMSVYKTDKQLIEMYTSQEGGSYGKLEIPLKELYQREVFIDLLTDAE